MLGFYQESVVHPVILFGIPILIWGSTWYVITFQLGTVPPEISVFYRFLLASAVAWATVWIGKQKTRIPWKDHPVLVAQGLFMFCLNYILTYHSEKYVVSGLVAVLFTLLLYFNMIGHWVFFRVRPSRLTWAAGALGAVGLYFIFRDQISIEHVQSSQNWWWGVGIGVVATGCASAGNMVATLYRPRNIPIFKGSAWAMAYGTVWTLLISLYLGHPFDVPHSWTYWSSMVYLAVPGTILSFYFYLKLIHERGPTQAGYTSVMVPVMALIVSSVFEGLVWTTSLIVGSVLIFLGQLLMLRGKKLGNQ